jgi:hypothetical protein
MDSKSMEQQDEKVRSVLPSVSRRAFLAGAATCAAAAPALLHSAVHTPFRQTLLHVATRVSHSGYVHTFLLSSDDCTLLGSTRIDSFAAFAAHPVLPILYVARDCREWDALPRGVIETYVVARSMSPLQLVAQAPMALSATGPRSLGVSPCGRHLLVSASTGGAWNAFALDPDGIPAVIAITRKETGIRLERHTVSMPTPHGLVFSPHGPHALGTDPGTGCMTLLQPSSETIAVLARHQTPCGLAPTSPVWTTDGRYVIVKNAQNASLSLYRMPEVFEKGSQASFHLVSTVPTFTPVTTLLAHASLPAIFTSRRQASGSRLERWKLDRSQLRIVTDTWVSGHVATLAQDGASLWAVSDDRVIRISIENLRDPNRLEMPLPMPGTRAVVTQRLPAHLINAHS